MVATVYLKPLLVFSFCQRFFFKSQVIAANKFEIGKCEDFVWVNKDELLEYFPEQADYLNKMIIS
jgi:large subunit ribosomal protein L46